jgi:hypothetical protein
VCAEHHHVCGGADLGLGDDVAGALGPNARIESEGGVARLGAQPCTGGLGDADCRDLHVGVLAEGPAHLVAVHIVGHDHCHRAAFGRRGLLHGELALTAVHSTTAPAKGRPS